MSDHIVSVPAIVLAAVPIGGMADAVGRFFSIDKADGAPSGLPFDFSIVTELMAAATCAFDEDDSPAAA